MLSWLYRLMGQSAFCMIGLRGPRETLVGSPYSSNCEHSRDFGGLQSYTAKSQRMWMTTQPIGVRGGFLLSGDLRG
ncbi:hypothetical protein LINPERHAP1_LOCUS37678 [Linum perenne]